MEKEGTSSHTERLIELQTLVDDAVEQYYAGAEMLNSRPPSNVKASDIQAEIERIAAPIVKIFAAYNNNAGLLPQKSRERIQEEINRLDLQSQDGGFPHILKIVEMLREELRHALGDHECRGQQQKRVFVGHPHRG